MSQTIVLILSEIQFGKVTKISVEMLTTFPEKGYTSFIKV